MRETMIRFWSGLSTIGGNIVSLEYDNHRIITDFGALIGANIEQLQDKSQMKALLEEHKLPHIAGLYESQYLQDFPLESLEDSAIETIICLSHLHLDHIGSFGQLSKNVKIYALDEAVSFYQQLQRTQLLPNYDMNWQPVQAHEWLTFGSFNIRFVPVDHDTIGAASVFIEAPDIKVVYSGDWRLTGNSPINIMKWAVEAHDFKPDILLMEGTTFSHVDTEPSAADERIAQMITSLDAKNEAQLIQQLKNLLMQYTEQLFTFNGYPQNIERMLALAKMLNEVGREMVLNNAYYSLLKPYLADDLVIRCVDEVTLDTIAEKPSQYLLQLESSNIEQIEQLPAGIYLHSNGMPLGSFDVKYEPFVRYIVELGWQFIVASVSGHATTTDLLLVNRVIDAKAIVPWHTFQPEVYAQALQQQGQQAWLPKYNQVYTWKQLKQSLNIL